MNQAVNRAVNQVLERAVRNVFIRMPPCWGVIHASKNESGYLFEFKLTLIYVVLI